MICNDCAYVADLTAKVTEAAKTSTLWATSPILPVHPHDCHCPCQHKPYGAWRGLRETEDNNSQ
jgi:hypothetical protein